jgi:hypothetical protein
MQHSASTNYATACPQTSVYASPIHNIQASGPTHVNGKVAVHKLLNYYGRREIGRGQKHKLYRNLQSGASTHFCCWSVHWTLSVLTLSGRMSIYNRYGDSASMDKCWYMIDKISFAFLPSYVATGHCILCQRIHECFVCLRPSGSHNFNFLRNKYHLYIMACHVLAACFYVQPNPSPLDWRNGYITLVWCRWRIY